MAKHALVFIHGMGEHTAGWHKPALKVLADALPTYQMFSGAKLEEFVEPVPVLYSDFFTALRAMWKKNVAAIKSALGAELEAVDTAERQRINSEFDSIANAIGAGADTFVWTHAMDVVLYRFFRFTRQKVNVHVASQMLQATDARFTQGWSIVAHSLGTAVTHNTLAALYTSPLLDGQPPLKPQETRPKALAMIANVSRVLQIPAAKVFSSPVMPGSAMDGRACGTYLNVRHLFDPFVYPQPFEPDPNWPPPGTFAPTQYQHIRPSDIAVDKLMQVHDLERYLANPRVHVPLFRAIIGPDAIPEAEFHDHVAEFDQQQQNANLDAIRHALEPLLPAKTADWAALLRSLFDLTGLKKP